MASRHPPDQPFVTHKTFKIPPQYDVPPPSRTRLQSYSYAREREREDRNYHSPRVVHLSKDLPQESKRSSGKPQRSRMRASPTNTDSRSLTSRSTTKNRNREREIEVVDSSPSQSRTTRTSRYTTRSASRSSTSSSSVSISSSSISPNTSPPPHTHHSHHHASAASTTSKASRPSRTLNRKPSILIPRGRSRRRSPSPTPSLLDPKPDPYIESIRHAQRERSRGRSLAALATIDNTAPESASLGELSRRQREGLHRHWSSDGETEDRHPGQRDRRRKVEEEYERAHLPTQRRLVRRESFTQDKNTRTHPRSHHIDDVDHDDGSTIVDIDVYESTTLPFRPQGRYRTREHDCDYEESSFSGNHERKPTRSLLRDRDRQPVAIPLRPKERLAQGHAHREHRSDGFYRAREDRRGYISRDEEGRMYRVR